MALSDFIGMRKLTIRDNVADTFVVLAPSKISADGLTATFEVNEGTFSTFAGDIAYNNGINLSAGTISTMPATIEDVGKLFPAGYNSTNGSWALPVGGCVSDDADLVFEKVCDTKGGVIFRHCSIALAFELGISRDDAFTIEISFYPSISKGSEYGYIGEQADEDYAMQMFNGLYDGATGAITFDA